MNKNKLKGLAACMVAALVMSGCNNDDTTVVDNDLVAVQFSATVGIGEVFPESRVANNIWETGDAIGIYMVKNGTMDIVSDAENRKYIRPGSGSPYQFNADTEQKLYFSKNEAEKVDFIAYYPHKESGNSADEIDDFVFSVDVSDQSDWNQIDILHATTSGETPGGYSKSDPAVALKFDHKLSKFTISASAGEGLSAADINAGLTIKIKGMNTQATFNVATGSFENEKNPQTIEAVYNTTARRQALVLPAEVINTGDWTVEFTINNEVYEWKVPAGTKLEGGKEHVWTIKIQKTPVVVSAQINPWTQGTGGEETVD